MPILTRQRLFLTTLLPAFLLAFVCSVCAHAPALRWDKIHVSHAAATVVFARLGLTHSTKNGHTRDGKQGVADPDFPPGLTDVVPNDAESMLLVRGTDEGMTLFRVRVQAADIAVPPMHLHAELSRRADTLDSPVGTQNNDAVADGLPLVLSLGSGDAPRIYQITMRANTDGSYWVACRVSLPLPFVPQTQTETPVFVPERVWADPLSRKVRPGEIAVFDDPAAVRQAAEHKLGMTALDTDGDYTLRVTLTSPVMQTTLPIPP